MIYTFNDICTSCKEIYSIENILLNTIQLKVATVENIKLLIIGGIQTHPWKEFCGHMVE